MHRYYAAQKSSYGAKVRKFCAGMVLGRGRILGKLLVSIKISFRSSPLDVDKEEFSST
jgi:hypothetical protein